jgi:phage I-like protein
MPDAKQCRAAWSYWNQAGNQDPYNPAERAIIEKRIRARAKAVGMQIQEETAMKDKLQQMLALKSEATDEEILGVVQAALKSSGLLTDLAVILGLEGTATADQVKGTVTALKGGQASLEQLQGEVAALRLDIAQRQAGELVDAALKDGKLSPVQRDWALKYAQEKPDEFKAFVAAAPKVVPLTEIRVPAGKNNQEGRLSEGELTVCRQMGLAPENYLATKQGLAQAN